MKFEEMADFLESYQDQVTLDFETWCMDNNPTKEQMDAVSSFVSYAVNKAKEDMTVERIGGSFLEKRRKYEYFEVPGRIESSQEKDFLCFVEIQGTELPVVMPMSAFTSHNLLIGDKFIWTTSKLFMEEVLPKDIKPFLEPTLTEQEESEAAKLYEEFLKSDDDWD